MAATSASDPARGQAPVHGAPELVNPLPGGRVSSGFGLRLDPISGERKPHGGIDVRSRYGDWVLVPADGVVAAAVGASEGEDEGPWGHHVQIDHGDGWTTFYAHLDRVEVREGQRVRQGQRLGTAGATGLATGPHLHFEIREDGSRRDPAAFVQEWSAKD
jgi:murein DD-endopeptidase MepM/ murein hydrolase activator NlpD